MWDEIAQRWHWNRKCSDYANRFLRKLSSSVLMKPFSNLIKIFVIDQNKSIKFHNEVLFQGIHFIRRKFSEYLKIDIWVLNKNDECCEGDGIIISFSTQTTMKFQLLAFFFMAVLAMALGMCTCTNFQQSFTIANIFVSPNFQPGSPDCFLSEKATITERNAFCHNWCMKKYQSTGICMLGWPKSWCAC